MSLVTQVKETLGLEEQPHRYRCRECDTEFESNLDPEDTFLECDDCGSDDVELVEEGS